MPLVTPPEKKDRRHGGFIAIGPPWDRERLSSPEQPLPTPKLNFELFGSRMPVSLNSGKKIRHPGRPQRSGLRGSCRTKGPFARIRTGYTCHDE